MKMIKHMVILSILLYSIVYSQDVNFYDKVVYIQATSLTELSAKVNKLYTLYSKRGVVQGTILTLGALSVDNGTYTQCVVISLGNLPKVVERVQNTK